MKTFAIILAWGPVVLFTTLLLWEVWRLRKGKDDSGDWKEDP